MAEVTVRLLRPLNGDEIGSERQYDQADAEELRDLGAVEIIGKNAGAAPSNKASPAAPDNKEVSMANTKAELVEIAKAEGVEIESDDNKADLIAKIERARG